MNGDKSADDTEPSGRENPYAAGFLALDILGRAILFEFGMRSLGTRDLITRNFLARCLRTIQSIGFLWEAEAFQDAWSLHRDLLDRYFHLVALARDDSFETFEAWSLVEQYKAVQRVRSDPDLSDDQRAEGLAFLAPESERRAKELLADPPKWRRPRAKEVAASLGMGFLYRFGYDFASTHVHPMANDGDEDFHFLTGGSREAFPDYEVLLSNSLLIGTVVVQQAMNGSTLQWRGLLYRILEEIVDYLPSRDPAVLRGLLALWELGSAGESLAADGSDAD